MLFWLLGCLFVVGQFGLQSQVLAGNPYYTCHAWGDPHLQTWRAHDTPLTHEQLQDCMTNGEFPLVQNQYVQYNVKLSGTYITEASLIFYNPTTKKPVCTLPAINPQVLSQNENQCKQNGVTWTLTGTSDYFTVIISYLVHDGNFTTSIQRQPSHCDVHVWQPHHWAGGSSGLCTHGDPKCTRTRTSLPNTRTKIITYTQAQSICQAYIDAYLARSQQKRSVVLSSTVSSIMEGCIDDVMLTGDAESAKSGLNVLLMEELTSDVTSADGIKQAIVSGIEEGTSRVEEAAQEARMKVARFL